MFMALLLSHEYFGKAMYVYIEPNAFDSQVGDFQTFWLIGRKEDALQK